MCTSMRAGTIEASSSRARTAGGWRTARSSTASRTVAGKPSARKASVTKNGLPRVAA
jgi:hypothetical protein